MSLDGDIDTIILGCTHYPLLMPKIRLYTPAGVTVVSQGDYVAASLKTYLGQHPEMDRKCSTGGSVHYLTTENPDKLGVGQHISQRADRRGQHHPALTAGMSGDGLEPGARL